MPFSRENRLPPVISSMLRCALLIIIILACIGLTTFGWRHPGGRELAQPRDPGRADRLKQHVIALSDDIGDRSVFEYAQLARAEAYITERFNDLGYSVEKQTYSVYNRPVSNIIAHRRGETAPDEIVIIGAHYDTCFNPGANDNASGVAALLELAGMAADMRSGRTIRFIAFVNEEPPFFKTEAMGSLVYARRARANNEDIRAAIILEMIGYYCTRPFSQRYPMLIGPFFPNRADFIAVVSNFANRELVRTVHSAFAAGSDMPIESASLFDFIPGVDFSDHWSFWQYDYPAVMVTDTAFYRYKHYHRETDTFEKLDYRTMAAVVDGLSGVLNHLAQVHPDDDD